MRRFIDNVAVLVVEMCLLDNLADIFSPTLVSAMSDGELKAIAGESAAQQGERHQLTEKTAKLKSALRECLAHGYTSTEGKLRLSVYPEACKTDPTPVLPPATSLDHTRTPQGDEFHAHPSTNVYSINAEQ